MNCLGTIKQKKNIPERVDAKLFGGGYVLNSDWLRLLCLSTFAIDIIHIDKNDISNYLTKLSYLNSNEIPLNE